MSADPATVIEEFETHRSSSTVAPLDVETSDCTSSGRIPESCASVLHDDLMQQLMHRVRAELAKHNADVLEKCIDLCNATEARLAMRVDELGAKLSDVQSASNISAADSHHETHSMISSCVELCKATEARLVTKIEGLDARLSDFSDTSKDIVATESMQTSTIRDIAGDALEMGALRHTI
jgi:hypothetical protein